MILIVRHPSRSPEHGRRDGRSKGFVQDERRWRRRQAANQNSSIVCIDNIRWGEEKEKKAQHPASAAISLSLSRS